MKYSTDWPPKGLRVVYRVCPIARSVSPGTAVSCNCIGHCQPILVSDEDVRTDAKIIEDYEASVDRGKGWVQDG